MTNVSAFGSDDEGWINMTVNGQNVVRPIFRAYAQFGPKLDGRQVYWWDGQMRAYTPQGNNWKAFYRTGYSSIANIAINNATDKMNYRFSYVRNDYKGIQIGGKQEKNTFNFNSSYKITPKVTLDLVANYINEKVHNRPRQIYYLTNNFGGLMVRAFTGNLPITPVTAGTIFIPIPLLLTARLKNTTMVSLPKKKKMVIYYF